MRLAPDEGAVEQQFLGGEAGAPPDPAADPAPGRGVEGDCRSGIAGVMDEPVAVDAVADGADPLADRAVRRYPVRSDVEAFVDRDGEVPVGAAEPVDVLTQPVDLPVEVVPGRSPR